MKRLVDRVLGSGVVAGFVPIIIYATIMFVVFGVIILLVKITS